MIEADALGSFTDAPFAIWTREYVRREGFSLVVIDPLSRFGGRESETDNFAATRFVQSLESLASPTCSVLNSHHTRKISRGGRRSMLRAAEGASALVDGARWQCALVVEALSFEDEATRLRLGEIVKLGVTKSNYAATPAPVVLRRDLDHGGAHLKFIEAARTASANTSAKREARQADGAVKVEAQDGAVLRAVRTISDVSLSKRAAV
jgi:RecA-family ATPase